MDSKKGLNRWYILLTLSFMALVCWGCPPVDITQTLDGEKVKISVDNGAFGI